MTNSLLCYLSDLQFAFSVSIAFIHYHAKSTKKPLISRIISKNSISVPSRSGFIRQITVMDGWILLSLKVLAFDVVF